ncbi:unnamed protein product, partial [Polarella glacialis]
MPEAARQRRLRAREGQIPLGDQRPHRNRPRTRPQTAKPGAPGSGGDKFVSKSLGWDLRALNDIAAILLSLSSQ